MTMPHLMNCPHSDDSWCIDCVKAEWELRQEEIERLQNLLKSVPPCQACLGNPMVQECSPWCKEAQRLRKIKP